ncbi:MAG: cell division protein FtsL [Myxococcales bacterium]|nr:cell division protein FtsL [Myxococcales bacterium]MCB9523276.1 cell division protein FtsL [Myxococcales bacterium]
MRFFLFALAALGTLSWTGLRVVRARHQAVALGYEIAKETDRQRALTEELRRLRIDRAALLSPAALEHVAKEAGLRVPQPDQVVVLAEEVTDGR